MLSKKHEYLLACIDRDESHICELHSRHDEPESTRIPASPDIGIGPACAHPTVPLVMPILRACVVLICHYALAHLRVYICKCVLLCMLHVVKRIAMKRYHSYKGRFHAMQTFGTHVASLDALSEIHV
jgi:hypothetical protein